MYPNAGAHNSLYRGKYLGNQVTDKQYAAIAAGTFDDLFIGDYWTINGRDYLIADFDYYRNNLNAHHIVMLPRKSMGSVKTMNSTATTAGGYSNCEMRKTGLDEAKEIINNDFPNHIFLFRDTFSSVVTNGIVTKCDDIFDCTVELLSEPLIFGGFINGSSTNGIVKVQNNYISNSQFSFFRYNKSSFMYGIGGVWLRDVVNSECFTKLFGLNYSMSQAANVKNSVLPYFCIRA